LTFSKNFDIIYFVNQTILMGYFFPGGLKNKEMIMARKAKKGPRRDIQVWGCIMKDGSEITANDPGVVSVYALKNYLVMTKDSNNVETIHTERGEWATANPRFN